VARRVREYSYEEMLDRAFQKLPAKLASSQQLSTLKPELMLVGGKTVILNFKDIADSLNRDPEVLQKYLGKELGVAAYTNESGQLVLQGKFNVQVITKLLEMFVQKYVKCPTCGSGDTRLEKKGRIFILKCMACGAETTLEAF